MEPCCLAHSQSYPAELKVKDNPPTPNSPKADHLARADDVIEQ
jgi:hypothetical protein